MKALTRFLVSVLAIAMLLGSFGLTALADAPIEITIPHYKSGENVGAKFFLPQVERFNEKYDGQYKIVIEELTQDMYNDKMKQLAQQGKLPAIIEGGDTEWMRNVAVPNKLYYDLTDVLKDNPALDALILDYNREYNTTEDGEYVSLNFNVVRPVGMYYNEDMLSLDKAPGEFADWAEFIAALGDEKIAMMTGENAWTSVLILSGLIAQEEGGLEILNAHQIDKLTDFNEEPIINAVAKFQEMLKNNASSNTVGAVYADAANAFMSKNAAVIANGSWMVGDFAADATDKWSNDFNGETVRGAVFPGNVAVSGTVGAYGWWIPSTATDEEKKVAVAFLTFMMTPEELEAYMLAEGGTCPTLEVSEEFLKKRAEESKLLDEYVGAVNAETTLVPNFSDCIPASVAANGFGTILPKLIDGTLSPEAFCQELSVMAQEAMDE